MSDNKNDNNDCIVFIVIPLISVRHGWPSGLCSVRRYIACDSDRRCSLGTFSSP